MMLQILQAFPQKNNGGGGAVAGGGNQQGANCGVECLKEVIPGDEHNEKHCRMTVNVYL